MSQTQVVHLKANVFEIPPESRYVTELYREVTVRLLDGPTQPVPAGVS